jgi:hypothetical protein
MSSSFSSAILTPTAKIKAPGEDVDTVRAKELQQTKAALLQLRNEVNGLQFFLMVFNSAMHINQQHYSSLVKSKVATVTMYRLRCA